MTEPARTTEFQPATARVRTRMPMLRTWSIPFRTKDGAMGYLDLVWATAGKWRTMSQSSDPEWQSLPLGPFVIGLRLLL